MLLSLPTLDPSIPASITFDAPNPHILRLASAMASVGQITKGDLAPLSRDAAGYGVVKGLIDDVWRRELAALFEFEVLEAHIDLHLPNMAGSDGFHEPPEGSPICSLTIGGAGQPTAFYVGPAMLALEEIHPGLGSTALDILDEALCFFCVPCTPSGANDMAKYLYWQGEDDEKAAIECYGEDLGDEDDLPRRDAIFAGIPAWACGGEVRKRLSKRAFARLTKPHSAHSLGPLLARLAEIDKLLGKDRGNGDQTRHLFRPDYDEFEGNECFEPPAVIYWQEDGPDQMERVFDDQFRQAMESGCEAPYQRFVRFYLDAEELSNALSRLRHTGHLCMALDKALVALRDWRDET